MPPLQSAITTIEAARVDASNNPDVAKSASDTIRTIVSVFEDVAVEATDLATLKAEIDARASMVHRNAQRLGDAIAQRSQQ